MSGHWLYLHESCKCHILVNCTRPILQTILTTEQHSRESLDLRTWFGSSPEPPRCPATRLTRTQTWRPRSPPPAASVWPRLWPQCWTARQRSLYCRNKPWTQTRNCVWMQNDARSVLQSTEANAHLVKEEGSVGGNPTALTWNTESSYHPVNADRSRDYRDPGAEQQRERDSPSARTKQDSV